MKESAFSYSQSQTETMKKVCEPLKVFGVDCVHYLRMFKNGRYLIFSNNDKFSRDFIFDLEKLSIIHGRIISSISEIHFHLWPEIPKNKVECTFAKTCWHGLCASKFELDYAEFWGFATSFDNYQIDDIYRKHINSFYHFVKLFDKWLITDFNVVEKIDNTKLASIELDLTIPWQLEQDKINKTNLSFFHSLYPKGIEVISRNGKVRISNREFDCLRLIREGKRVKEIALQLQISNRTVDQHLANIHNKTGYSANSQLVQLYDDQLAEIMHILKRDAT